MIEIKLIDKEHRQDINIPNEPFALWGRMIPSYKDEKWSYTVEHFDPQDVSEMRFPDENYDYMEMCNNSIFIGAYDGGECIGLAIMKDALLKYMYLYDLKVNKEYRNQGVASMLITRAKEAVIEKGYHGIYTQGQDNNLSACLFYLKCGFHIGGLDTNVYKGTAQEGKSDILFYLDIKHLEKPKTIEEYIRRQDKEKQADLSLVRQVLQQALPEAEERISWGMPTYWKNHNILHFAASKKHIGLYPGPEAVMEFKEELEKCSVDKGTIRIPYGGVDTDLIKKIALWCWNTGNHA